MNICFIGGGNMARAMMGGLLQQNYSPERLRAVEIDAGQREEIKRKFNVQVRADLAKGIAGSNILVLAVKPQQLAGVARELGPLLHDQLVISIAAGIRAADISRWLGGHAAIVRAMPNTPALIGAGVTGLYALPAVDDQGKQKAEAVLAAIGEVLWCPHEEMLDAVTAISGSGPAYVFYFMEAVQKAATEMGFTPEQARQLTVGTFLGAVTLASQSDEGPATLRARVTSPGGTTERAIRSLESSKVQDAIIDAIRACYDRSRELGDEFGKS